MEIIEESDTFELVDSADVDREEAYRTRHGLIHWHPGADDGYGEKVIVVDHTQVDSRYRGQGFAGLLMAALVDKARREGLKIVPQCSFAFREFGRHPEYADVHREPLE